MVLTDCGGALTFTGIVTNNGSLRAVNGSVLESYGPVVNNGVINVIAGQTNFHSGFVNNGVVLSQVAGNALAVTLSSQNPTANIGFTDSNNTFYLQAAAAESPADFARLLHSARS